MDQNPICPEDEDAEARHVRLRAALGLSQPLHASLILSLPSSKRSQLLTEVSTEALETLKDYWPFWARPNQLPPTHAWRTWLIMGGRGSGKTRSAAEWVRDKMETQSCSCMALVGATYADVRDVMVEGRSGLQAISCRRNRPTYEASRRRLVWPNGGFAMLFSAEDPDSLRGPQFDGAWGDEFAAWSKPDAVLNTLRPALRIGADPQLVLSTTPRPIPSIKRLLSDPTCTVSKSATRDNVVHLSKGFVKDLAALWAGSIWARQELEGEMVEDPTGALWKREDIENARGLTPPPVLDRLVIAVDPPASIGRKASTCGIIVAGAAGEGLQRRAVVLADLSVQGLSPPEWSAVVARAYDAFGANMIVAEANQGGEMVRSVLRLAAPQAPIRLVHASRGKRARAEPVALLYSQGRVSHAAHFRSLEDQMCSFGALGFTSSPDRVDALVWALTDLLLDRSATPSARNL